MWSNRRNIKGGGIAEEWTWIIEGGIELLESENNKVFSSKKVVVFLDDPTLHWMR
jgi:hypothetical protein